MHIDLVTLLIISTGIGLCSFNTSSFIILLLFILFFISDLFSSNFILFSSSFSIFKAFLLISILSLISLSFLASFLSLFFLNYSEPLKYLITNYHIINPDIKNEDIEIQIWNKKTMKLKFMNRITKFIKKPKDIALIEIKGSDEIYQDIEFLDYDLNYVNKGYSMYQDADIFTIEHPYGKGASCASGKIVNINKYQFDHNIATDNGSSGCPIILLNNNINLVQVIGVHKNADLLKSLNGGTFIGEIFNEKNRDFIVEKNNNYILAEIDIKEKDVNKDIRIINSNEEYLRTGNDKNNFKKDDVFNNEDEIKNCEIIINNLLIPFNYFYKFPVKGKYKIKYSFNKKIKKCIFMFAECISLTNIDLSNFDSSSVYNISSMFYDCSSLTNIDFSNFDTKNVYDMEYLFRCCFRLTDIDLSDFNTQNVKYMNSMFRGCNSLKKINLSGFNTENVNRMDYMFYGCSSLINIDLSSFNTQNVNDMNFMFGWCTSLKSINLSSFKTQNVNDMSGMFGRCYSLKSIDLSNFNTENVLDMNFMFSYCSSLTYLNLSNFNTKNVKQMLFMFYGCSSLTKEKVIFNDDNVESKLTSLCSIF